jgi:hypothetical protein
VSGFSAELANLRAVRATLAAALIQVDTRMQVITGGAVPDEVDGCPQCGGLELAPAGDVEVCAKCGANVRDGAVVAG